MSNYGSSALGAIGIIILVVFGGSYIYNEAIGQSLVFSGDIINIILVGIVVVVIGVSIYSLFDIN
jgi:hypothetical protein